MTSAFIHDPKNVSSFQKCAGSLSHDTTARVCVCVCVCAVMTISFFCVIITQQCGVSKDGAALGAFIGVDSELESCLGAMHLLFVPENKADLISAYQELKKIYDFKSKKTLFFTGDPKP